jgi:hypothetical protein
MSRIECKYTQTPNGGIVGEYRWVDAATGKVYQYETSEGAQTADGTHVRAILNADGSYSFKSSTWPDKQFVLTPTHKQEVPLTDSKCPIRSQFTDQQVRDAYDLSGKSVKRTAEALSIEGGVSVSRQLCRFWLKGLKLHTGKVAAGKKSPRVLLIDIETAPILAYVWSLWKQNVGLNQINNEWYILSFCAKWLGEPEVIYKDIRDTPHDDSSLMQPLWDLLNEADIIIGQNGKAFDMPKIQARLIMAGHLPPRPYKVIDTLLMAKQQFRFTSNKLEWMTGETAGLTTVSKSKHSKFPGFLLWSECLKGNPEAWDEMKEYNIPDVTSMEELYIKLRPWYVGHPNMAVYLDTDKIACPKCASHDVVQDGFTFTQVGKYELYKCNGCGGFSRGRYTRNSTSVRKALLSN